MDAASWRQPWNARTGGEKVAIIGWEEYDKTIRKNIYSIIDRILTQKNNDLKEEFESPLLEVMTFCYYLFDNINIHYYYNLELII